MTQTLRSSPAFATQPVVHPSGWQPIETAPKDGTIIFLLVWQDLFAVSSSNPTEDEISFRTIGHNNYDHDGIDCWQFAGWNWEQDCYTEARGKPIHWQPLPDPPEQP
jgi:hypothetical protein